MSGCFSRYFWTSAVKSSDSPRVAIARWPISPPPYIPIIVPAAITAGNVISTNGYYWSNGAPYSTGSSFTGNLAGSTLLDSVNERIFANASPQSTQFFRGGSYFGANTSSSALSTPVGYSNGYVTAGGIAGMQVQANLNLITGAGGARKADAALWTKAKAAKARKKKKK